MKVRINVTKNDILEGCQHDANECAVARTIGQRCRSSVNVTVTRDTIGLLKGNLYKGIETSETAEQFITKFDAATDVKRLKPIRFTLDIPKKFLRSTLS
jgi:hypothetical protein